MHSARTCAAWASVVLIALVLLSCSSPKADPGSRSALTPPSPALDRVTMEQAAGPLGVGRVYALPAFASIDGVRADAASLMAGKSVVVIGMTSSGCPVSQKYGPRLAGLEREYGPRGVAFLHVNTVAAESDAEIREQIADAGFRGMYAPDRDRALARVLRPRTTSEVYVFDSAWTLRYRGALDDQFGVGVALEAPRRMFLRDAMEAVLKKETPAVAATWAPGCLVDAPDAARDMLAAGGMPAKPNPPQRGITYYNRVAHILDRYCLDCHRTNGPGPFNLASASSIEGRAAMIAAVVRDGLMPPSHGEETSHGAASWRSPRSMPEQDRADLIAWLSSNRPLGNPGDGPKPTARPQGWTRGTPDLVLVGATMRLPADGPLMHERSILSTEMTEDLWIRAIDVRPMKQGTIERAVAWVVPPGVAVRGTEADLSSVKGLEMLVAFSPGHGFVEYPTASARRLRAGSTVIVDTYARPMGRTMGVAARLGVYTRRPGEAITHEVKAATVIASAFEIAAGESARWERASLKLGEDAMVLALTPGMGPRGKALRATASSTSGGVEDLLRLDRFDARWLVRYEPTAALAVQRGSVLALEGLFDNSDANASNPSPGEVARSGAGATDEWLWLGVEYLVPIEGSRK